MSLSRLQKEFDSAEHKSLGDVQIPGLPDEFTHFTFPGGAKLTFGEIIALAGDYFGVALDPISLGKSDGDRRKRFLAAYATLAICAPKDIYNITKEIVIEGDNAEAAVSKGEAESIGVGKTSQEETKVALESTKGNYLTLAEHNLDHFNDQAHIAFETGFALAMEAAVEAATLSDPLAKQKQLEYAYTLLAFACHFMTDLFASGHMRTPRADLEAAFGPEIGSLLSLFQHNEDGDIGLEVTGESVGDKKMSIWQAYGDGHLFEKKSKENQDRALMAVQEAVNEIHRSYMSGEALTFNQSVVMGLIPAVTKNNHPPMFKVEENKLLCRTSVGDEPKDEYTELTHLKALEILTHHAEQYADKSITDRIASFKRSLESGEKRIEDDFSQLPSGSIFAQPKKAPTPKNSNATNESKRSCPCVLI